MELNNIRNRNFVYEGQVLALQASARVAPPVEAQVPVDNVVPHAALAEVARSQEAAEPASEKEAEELGPDAVAGQRRRRHRRIPRDYSVHEGNTMRVQAAETVGHYAEWLEVRASQVRKLNRMTAATPVVIGRKLKLDFSKVTPDQFEARREAYHKQLQEAFFTEFRISGDETHVIKSGESIWVLAQQRYNIPIWLLRQYNPDLDLGSMQAGNETGDSDGRSGEHRCGTSATGGGKRSSRSCAGGDTLCARVESRASRCAVARSRLPRSDRLHDRSRPTTGRSSHSDEVAHISGDLRFTAGVPVSALLRQVDGRTLSVSQSAVDVLPGESHAAGRLSGPGDGETSRFRLDVRSRCRRTLSPGPETGPGCGSAWRCVSRSGVIGTRLGT